MLTPRSLCGASTKEFQTPLFLTFGVGDRDLCSLLFISSEINASPSFHPWTRQDFALPHTEFITREISPSPPFTCLQSGHMSVGRRFCAAERCCGSEQPRADRDETIRMGLQQMSPDVPECLRVHPYGWRTDCVFRSGHSLAMGCISEL